jgi:biotin operon repressor
MSPPTPPRPDIVRRPQCGFGWLDDRLLHDGWLRDLGPDATAILLLLALAADRRGASFFSRDKMARSLGLDRHRVDQALHRLQDLGLVAHRPWRQGHPDGVWQLLPVPERQPSIRAHSTLSAAQILRQLGLRT